MTTQEAYEKMRAWFCKPGRKFGYDAEEKTCRYRAGLNPRSTKRCAVGCLIPNRLYGGVDMECDTPRQIAEDLPGIFGSTDPEFLLQAQNIHDDCAMEGEPMEVFIRLLDALAASWKLNVVQA